MSQLYEIFSPVLYLNNINFTTFTSIVPNHRNSDLLLNRVVCHCVHTPGSGLASHQVFSTKEGLGMNQVGTIIRRQGQGPNMGPRVCLFGPVKNLLVKNLMSL